MRNTEMRLRPLEAATALPSRVVVVDGYSGEEHAAKIAALKAWGEASDRDLFVCLRRFADCDELRSAQDIHRERRSRGASQSFEGPPSSRPEIDRAPYLASQSSRIAYSIRIPGTTERPRAAPRRVSAPRFPQSAGTGQRRRL